MSYKNPTRLRIGSTGNLAGDNYRVTGWAVMKVVTSGEDYYWIEFNIECNDGHSATLVYEETEQGGEWRLFLLVEPKNPISAADAATRRVGDVLTLDGKTYRITLLDKSRVCRVEGKTAEGVIPGQVANYFNAQDGSNLMVVSWTGEEVEYFQGWTLPSSTVEKAFNIPQPILGNYTLSRAPASSESKGISAIVVVAILMLLYFVAPASCSRLSRRDDAVKTFPLPTTQLKIGATGNLAGRNFRIVGHDIATITEVGRRFSRHEFALSDDEGASFLLISGLTPGSKDWLLLQPLPQNSVPLTPKQAGNARLGQSIEMDGANAKVTGLFFSSIRRAEDATQTGTWDVETYGFSGRAGNTFVQARWNEASIVVYRGHLLTEKTILRAFKGPSGK